MIPFSAVSLSKTHYSSVIPFSAMSLSKTLYSSVIPFSAVSLSKTLYSSVIPFSAVSLSKTLNRVSVHAEHRVSQSIRSLHDQLSVIIISTTNDYWPFWVRFVPVAVVSQGP